MILESGRLKDQIMKDLGLRLEDLPDFKPIIYKNDNILIVLNKDCSFTEFSIDNTFSVLWNSHNDKEMVGFIIYGIDDWKINVE